MPSPSKKRKLNSENKNEKPKTKGLEYFFSKQRLRDGADVSSELGPLTQQDEGESSNLTDEQLARKLQDEWDKEERTTYTEPAEPSMIDPNASAPTLRIPVIEESAVPLHEAELAEPSKSTLKLQSAGLQEDDITSSIPLDESPITFEPMKYVNALKEHWNKDGGSASYALLTRCFFLVSGTTSRIKIVDTLVNCLRILIDGDPASLLPAVSLFPFVCWKMSPKKLTSLGMACDEFNIPSIYIIRIRAWRIGNLKGIEKCLWLG